MCQTQLPDAADESGGIARRRPGREIGCADRRRQARSDGRHHLPTQLGGCRRALARQGGGENLIRRALELAPADATVFLTTLEDRQALYNPFAFEVCDPTNDQVPANIQLEVVLGSALFSTTNLIVMRRN